MHFPTVLAVIGSLASLAQPVTADLRITADHHSFAGVNYPNLQFFTKRHRDDTIKEIIKSGARVIRLFIRGDLNHKDPESELGGFDKSMLDQFDDTLAAIHFLSQGQIKVIIAPHDAHALRGSNDVPCDAYCEKIDGHFLDFYSREDIRELYKTRLDVFFKHYESKNFGGQTWNKLPEVILGVDLQNQPFSGISPIPAGESWLCDIATHLKYSVGLDASNIAVISGGVSGAQKVDGTENFPNSVFDCGAIDVIGIHGYFEKKDDETAGTPWAKMFVPGNTLTSRAHGKKKGKGKLLLVEELSYIHTKFGNFYKKEAIFDQGNALNYRGIPWIYSYLSPHNEGMTSKVNILRPAYPAWGALKDVIKRAKTSRSNFDWSKFLTPPIAGEAILKPKENQTEIRLERAGLTNLTSVTLNPHVLDQSDCTFGCEGHLCNSADGCEPDLICHNSICTRNRPSQPGQIGDTCNSKKLCQAHLRCEDGECQTCIARVTIQPAEEKRRPTIKGQVPTSDPRKVRIRTNNPAGTCYTDNLPALFELRSSYGPEDNLPICVKPTRGNPCESAIHCDANEFCDWGVCKACGPKDACLGAVCKTNNKCKTGFCNSHGRCDYPGHKEKPKGPGASARKGGRPLNAGNAPMGQERGPAKVRDEAMRINIPKEKIQETARAATE